MSLGLIVLIILVLLILGSVPVYPYSREWGYAPMGGLGAILVIIILLIVLGIIPISVDSNGGIDVDLPNVEISDGD